MERRFHGRLGTIRDAGERHVYPLVGVYAERFVAPRFALVGDAAVGMHPVTAHGFNLGLLGVERLSGAIRDGHARWVDVVDFYSRHNCHRHAFFDGYEHVDGPAARLPALPP